jgi:hypothetical protein
VARTPPGVRATAFFSATPVFSRNLLRLLIIRSVVVVRALLQNSRICFKGLDVSQANLSRY